MMVHNRPKINQPVCRNQQRRQRKHRQHFGLPERGNQRPALRKRQQQRQRKHAGPHNALRQNLFRRHGGMVERIPKQGEQAPNAVASQCQPDAFALFG